MGTVIIPFYKREWGQSKKMTCLRQPRLCLSASSGQSLSPPQHDISHSTHYLVTALWQRGFPGGSYSRESTCNEGDPGSIPELGRSIEEGKATHSSNLAWKIPWTEEPGGLQTARGVLCPWGHKESDMTGVTNTFIFIAVERHQ